jgi:hypothetical protein
MVVGLSSSGGKGGEREEGVGEGVEVGVDAAGLHAGGQRTYERVLLAAKLKADTCEDLGKREVALETIARLGKTGHADCAAGGEREREEVGGGGGVGLDLVRIRRGKGMAPRHVELGGGLCGEDGGGLPNCAIWRSVIATNGQRTPPTSLMRSGSAQTARP